MKVLILAPFFAGQLERLRKLGVEVVYENWLETNMLWDPGELGKRLAGEGFEALIVEADFVFAEVFEAAPGLQFVGICRNALNHVDLEAATTRGIAVSHARGRNTNAVAEMTIGLVLSLFRRIIPAHGLVSGGGWRDPVAGVRRFRGREIAGAAIGVAGFGQIGRAVTEKLGALGAKVTVYDPYVPARQVTAMGAKAVPNLSQLAKACELVTVHAAENRGTKKMIDAAFFSKMRARSYFISTSAGSIVDQEAVAAALESGQLAGAALDVFDGHPLPASSALMTAPNLILTPHIGGATEETVERHSRMMVGEVERLLAGKALRFRVNE
jgi:D-3-phosphoglycerate dehydrogenase